MIWNEDDSQVTEPQFSDTESQDSYITGLNTRGRGQWVEIDPPQRQSDPHQECYIWDQYLNGPLPTPYEYDSDNTSVDSDIQRAFDLRLNQCSIRDDFDTVFEEYVQSRVLEQEANVRKSQSWWQWFKSKLCVGWT